MRINNSSIPNSMMEGFNQKYYEELIENLPVAIYTCNMEGLITSYNKAAVKLWGGEPVIGTDKWYGSCKIYKADGLTLIHPDSSPMAKMLRLENLSDTEIVLHNGKGYQTYIEPHSTFIYDEWNKIIGTANTLLNITDRKIAEKKNLENQLRIKTISQSAPVGLWITDADAGCNFVNQTWMEWSGASFEESMGNGWIKRIIDEDRDVIKTLFHSACVKKEDFKSEFRLVRTDGGFRWCFIEASPFYDLDGIFRGYTAYVTDITEKKSGQKELEKIVDERTKSLRQRNRELKNSEERYHRMTEEVQDYAIILLDIKGTILNWNKGAERIKGYSEKEIIGKNFRLFYLPEDIESYLPEKLISMAVETGRAASEGWRRRKDGTAFWGSIVITALHDDKNNIIGFSKVTRDLTERKKSEDTMKQYLVELERQNAELEQFAYVSSHDLQEPLRKIRTFSDLLETQITDEDQKKYLNKINSSAERMTNLIKDLLNYSSLSKENEEFVSVDLNEILENVKTDLEVVIEQKGATINAERLPVIKGIAIQFNQLFTNLLNNALKFNTSKPLINIEARPAMLYETVALNLDPKCSYFKLVFSDNGIGFEPHYSDQIFTIFQRLNTRQKFSGTGIGLAMCKKIIDNHKGHISAQGAPDQGASFTIYLPV